MLSGLVLGVVYLGIGCVCGWWVWFWWFCCGRGLLVFLVIGVCSVVCFRWCCGFWCWCDRCCCLCVGRCLLSWCCWIGCVCCWGFFGRCWLGIFWLGSFCFFLFCVLVGWFWCFVCWCIGWFCCWSCRLGFVVLCVDLVFCLGGVVVGLVVFVWWFRYLVGFGILRSCRCICWWVCCWVCWGFVGGSVGGFWVGCVGVGR